MPTEQDLNNIKAELEERTEALRHLVEWYLKNDGDTEETSQRLCLLNRISDVETYINGITVDDLKGE